MFGDGMDHHGIIAVGQGRPQDHDHISEDLFFGRLFFAGLLIAQLRRGFFHFTDGIFREGYTLPAAQDHGDSGLGDACIFCQISCRDLISFTHLFLLSGLPVPLSADVCRGFQPFFGTLSGTLSGMFCRLFSPFDRFDLF